MTEFERELAIMFTEKMKEKDDKIKELEQTVAEHRAVAKLYKELYEDAISMLGNIVEDIDYDRD